MRWAALECHWMFPMGVGNSHGPVSKWHASSRYSVNSSRKRPSCDGSHDGNWSLAPPKPCILCNTSTLCHPRRHSASRRTLFHTSAGKHLDPAEGTAFGNSPNFTYVAPAAASPQTSSTYANPSTPPTNFPGPSGKPLPVVTFEKTLSPNTPASTRYETPSMAPSIPYGPGGSPQPVVNSVYSE